MPFTQIFLQSLQLTQASAEEKTIEVHWELKTPDNTLLQGDLKLPVQEGLARWVISGRHCHTLCLDGILYEITRIPNGIYAC